MILGLGLHGTIIKDFLWIAEAFKPGNYAMTRPTSSAGGWPQPPQQHGVPASGPAVGSGCGTPTTAALAALAGGRRVQVYGVAAAAANRLRSGGGSVSTAQTSTKPALAAAAPSNQHNHQSGYGVAGR